VVTTTSISGLLGDGFYGPLIVSEWSVLAEDGLNRDPEACRRLEFTTNSCGAKERYFSVQLIKA
jgi:hypothetical protein